MLTHSAAPDDRCCVEEDSYIMQSVVVVSDEKPMTDGLTSDNNGNIWMTALQQSSIAVAVPNGDGKAIIKKVVRDPTLIRWPDGMSFGPDGIYFTNSVLHKKLASGQSLRWQHLDCSSILQSNCKRLIYVST